MAKKIKFQRSDKYPLYKLISELIDFGYERVERTDNFGEFDVHGDLINIWPVFSEKIYTIDYFGDVVEKISLENREKKSIEIDENILRFEDGSRSKPGDYVVHVDHGIGLFEHLGMKDFQGEKKEYIYIAYQNQDMLYVPIHLIDDITPYIGVGRKPKLNRLGGVSFRNAKKRAYDDVITLARELISIYAQRENASKLPYTIDENWEKKLREGFLFIETDDQKRAIENVYSDLSKEKPMDRLISGDVGFGKTEVAIRAIAHCVNNGKQAVLLCPTTVLALQHEENIKKRFLDLPIRVEGLSRFKTKEKQKSVIKLANEGLVDVVVGTHRLLSGDVKFRNLDLLVIDEEQRFGVVQKEKMKKFREKINILSLSATPIPRTLFMSLSGIRDISQINTPPKGRKRIETEVLKYDEKKIYEYLKREIDRSGQAYYLFNDVQRIEVKRNQIAKMFPKNIVKSAHGQMAEGMLAQRMGEFAGGEIDILVCSTIMENGLDLSNVNTLVVENSDHFGLSQLYQIRGRIGRSPKQAYCLLTHNFENLPENAFKRLRALVENSEIGSGFNVALSDLEIRGGGNILGKQQHGAMEAVGLVLYSKLLKEAVRRLKN